MRRLEDAKRANPEQKWIVVDPRRTETAEVADLHLQILPGTDVALFNGMAHLLLWEGLADRGFIDAHTNGFDALRDVVRNCTPHLTAQLCGIKEEDLVQAVRWFGQNTPTLSLYCQGLNQSTSGTDKNAALINLHLLTGQIGKPGAGPFSLTGQPNAMGGREVGGLANLLSAHRDLNNSQHRAEVAALWGVEDVPVQARQERGRDVPDGSRWRDRRAVDRLHEPGAVDARSGRWCAARWSAARSSSCRKRMRQRRPRPTPT